MTDFVDSRHFEDQIGEAFHTADMLGRRLVQEFKPHELDTTHLEPSLKKFMGPHVSFPRMVFVPMSDTKRLNEIIESVGYDYIVKEREQWGLYNRVLDLALTFRDYEGYRQIPEQPSQMEEFGTYATAAHEFAHGAKTSKATNPFARPGDTLRDDHVVLQKEGKNLILVPHKKKCGLRYQDGGGFLEEAFAERAANIWVVDALRSGKYPYIRMRIERELQRYGVSLDNDGIENYSVSVPSGIPGREVEVAAMSLRFNRYGAMERSYAASNVAAVNAIDALHPGFWDAIIQGRERGKQEDAYGEIDHILEHKLGPDIPQRVFQTARNGKSFEETSLLLHERIDSALDDYYEE